MSQPLPAPHRATATSTVIAFIVGAVVGLVALGYLAVVLNDTVENAGWYAFGLGVSLAVVGYTTWQRHRTRQHPEG